MATSKTSSFSPSPAGEVLVCGATDTPTHVPGVPVWDEPLAALRESEERFRLAVEHLPDPFAIYDRDGRIAFVNARAVALSGYLREQILGKTDAELFPPAIGDAFTSLRERAMHTRRPCTEEMAIEMPEGTYTIIGMAVPLLDDDGAVRQVLALTHDITARKRAEEVRARLADIVESSSDAIIALSLSGEILSWNAGAERLYGYTADEVVGESFQRFLPPDWQDDVQEVMQQLLRGESAGPYETTRITKSRQRICVSARVSPMRDATGRIVAWSTIHHDITKQKESEAALRASEQHARALLEVAKDLGGQLDLAELLRRAHERTAELLPCDRVATYYRDPVRQVFRPIAMHGVPADLYAYAQTVEFPLDHPALRLLAEGPIVINDTTAQSIVAPEVFAQLGVTSCVAVPLTIRGRLVGALSAINENGSRHIGPREVAVLEGVGRLLALGIEGVELYQTQQEEAEVSAALARVGRELISSLNTPVLLERVCRLTCDALRADGCVTLLWQPHLEAYQPVAVFGRLTEQWDVLRLLHLPRAMFDGVMGLLEEGDAVLAPLAQSLNPTVVALGHQFGIHSIVYIALRRQHEVFGLQAVCYRDDIWPLQAPARRIATGIAQLASMALANAHLLEELERASRLRSEFVATMSHELRTPMNIIMGYHNLLLDGTFGALSPDQTDILVRADRSSRELLELINNTLDLSRLESGRVTVDVGPVDLADVLDEVDVETRALRTKPNVRFTCQAGRTLPMLQTDQAKVKIVLKNLVVNALKFTERGSVSVSARAIDGVTMEIVVEDTGIGIPGDMQAIIFESFRQGETGRRHGGAGLGLYIVRRLLEMLGGSIDVDSEPGRGSTFTVRLPLRNDLVI